MRWRLITAAWTETATAVALPDPPHQLALTSTGPMSTPRKSEVETVAVATGAAKKWQMQGKLSPVVAVLP